MANKEAVSREIVYEFGKYLKKYIPAICAVYPEFPESNMELEYPAASLIGGNVAFRPEMNVYELSATQDRFALEQLYVWGDYEWPLQLDIWCSSKEERWRILNEFEKLMMRQFMDNCTIGVTLNLENYYNTHTRYDYEGYNFADDAEETSQRKEWRVKISLLAHCKAIHSQKEFAMANFELDTEQISETVVIPNE